MTPFDQTLSAVAMNLVADLCQVFASTYNNHPPYTTFDDLIVHVNEVLDTTGFFSELEIYQVNEDKIVNITLGKPDTTPADVFHGTLYNNALIQNKTSVFNLESSTVFLAYVHSITTPVYLIYASKKNNIQTHLISTMLNSVICLLNNLHTKYHQQPSV
jgi:hypothetical protein